MNSVIFAIHAMLCDKCKLKKDEKLCPKCKKAVKEFAERNKKGKD